MSTKVFAADMTLQQMPGRSSEGHLVFFSLSCSTTMQYSGFNSPINAMCSLMTVIRCHVKANFNNEEVCDWVHFNAYSCLQKRIKKPFQDLNS